MGKEKVERSGKFGETTPHNVRCCPEEDCHRSKSTLGSVEGEAEEGGLARAHSKSANKWNHLACGAHFRSGVACLVWSVSALPSPGLAHAE